MQRPDLCSYAVDIAARLLSAVEGDPQDVPAWVWMNAGSGTPVTAFYKRDGRRGCFVVDGLGRSHICYNIAYPASFQLRVLVHESAHAVIAADDPFPEINFVANYDDPLTDDRHRVCREVEAIIVCRLRAWND